MSFASLFNHEHRTAHATCASSYGRGLTPHKPNPIALFSLDGQLRAAVATAPARLFIAAKAIGANRPLLQSLPNQHLSQSLADRLKAHPYRLSFGTTDLEISCEPKGLGNVRKAFGELRNV